MKITAFDPAGANTGLGKVSTHILVGVHYNRIRARYAAGYQKPGHLLAGTVPDTEAAVHHSAPLLLKSHKPFHRPDLAAHVDNHIFLNIGPCKLFLAHHPHLAATLAETRHHLVEDRRIVPHMVRGECPGTHHSGDFDSSHSSAFLMSEAWSTSMMRPMSKAHRRCPELTRAR